MQAVYRVTVTNSRFTIGDAAFPDDPVSLTLYVEAGYDKGMTFTDSDITYTSAGDTWIQAGYVSSDKGIFDFTGNTIAGLVGKSETALSIGVGEVEVDSEFIVNINDNVFTGFKRAFYIEVDDSSAGLVTGEIHNNMLDFDISAVGDVALLKDVTFSVAYFDASHNTWGTHTDSATVAGLIQTIGTGDSSTFNVTPITPAL